MQLENIDSADLPLENLRSEHCAQLIDSAIGKIEGITNHQVEFNNKKAKISGRNITELIQRTVSVIRNLGYEVHSIKGNFTIMGMTCASCAISSQSILLSQKGLITASVNYANAKAVIEYIPELTNPLQLKAALQSIGYDLYLEENKNQESTIEELQEKEFKKLKNRTIGATLFSLPLFVIAMIPSLMNMAYANYIMWFLATPVVLFFGKQFFTGAFKQIKHGSANMDTLIALSTGIAYLFSIFNTLVPDYWHNKGLHAHVYFESSAVVITFILLGKLLEERAKNKTGTALKKLIGLQPKETIRIKDGKESIISLSEIITGDTLLVKPGEKIAVDGEVIEGSSFVDESMINGEPIASEKNVGSKVFAGTINQKGSFQFRAEKVGSNTLLAQIISMVQDAQGSKAPVQKTVDKIAGIFVPLVVAIALLSFTAWLTLEKENGLTHGLLSFITVLVIACPCALGLATPTAIMVGIGKGAEMGILIKDAESLEIAKRINAVVLDKTGTITEGKPTVRELIWFEEEKKELRDLLYSIERSSEHPLADAVSSHLHGAEYIKNIKIENLIGKGIKGEFLTSIYYVGNKNLLKEKGIQLNTAAQKWLDQKSAIANTVIFFCNEKIVIAGIAITDEIKQTSANAIQKLINKGIEVHMLTGDNEQTASSVALATGIKQFRANMLPSEKSDYIKELQKNGKVVAMVGDGINDSNALAQADVSIAMGKGSDIAMDVAKMTIIANDLNKIEQAIELSRLTVVTVRQNLFWASIYNLIGIPIAAGILYPINGFLLDPMIAGGAMALSSVSVVTNSLLLKFKKIAK